MSAQHRRTITLYFPSQKDFTLYKFQVDPKPIPKIAEPGLYKAIIIQHRRKPDRQVAAIEFTLRLT